METLSFEVGGMHCGGCAGKVRNALSTLAGVRNIEVTLNPGKATVMADPARVTPAQIESAITALGYSVKAHPAEHGAAAHFE